MAGAERELVPRHHPRGHADQRGRGRAFVSKHLVDHRLTFLVDTVRLVVSELATNALVHGQTAFVVTLSREDDTVRVTVQ